MLDFATIEQARTCWVDLGPQFHEQGPGGETQRVEVLVRAVTPKEGEIFRQGMVRAGITAKDGEIQPGKLREFCEALAEKYVIDWRGPIRLGANENPPYSSKDFARALLASTTALKAVTEAIGDEQRFFVRHGTGQT